MGIIQDTAARVGKSAGDEDFPVASIFLPKGLRTPVMAYYRFARLADDIADSPDLNKMEKLARLDSLEMDLGAPGIQSGVGPLTGGPSREAASREALTLRAALDATGVNDRHARDLLKAFRADAKNQGCANWEDLIAYCRHSAMPVGRFLLELTGETDTPTHTASDALCAALQITNHLKDMGADYRELDRIYLPRNWMREAGARREDLATPAMTTPLVNVYHRVLAATQPLIAQARTLPGMIGHRGLRMQAAISVACAARLFDKLSQGDPLAMDLSLNKRDWAICLARGITGRIAS